MVVAVGKQVGGAPFQAQDTEVTQRLDWQAIGRIDHLYGQFSSCQSFTDPTGLKRQTHKH